jgi:uncharacterized membrane protein YedE/YeeE
MRKEDTGDAERKSPRGAEYSLSYWIARIIFGLFLGLLVAAVTFFLFVRIAWLTSDDDFDWTAKAAAAAGGLSGLLFILMGPGFLDTIHAILFGPRRRF